MSSPAMKDEAPPMKTEEEPPSKKPRKDDDERVHRAALLLIKSQMLSVPQVKRILILVGVREPPFRHRVWPCLKSSSRF